MSGKELRRSMAILPIGTVIKLTSLSARQIRYYEENKLILPERSDGNRRLFSLNDVDRLLEIKDYLDEGFNMAEIKEVQVKQARRAQKTLSDSQTRHLLRDELLKTGRLADSDGPTFPMKRI